MLGLRSMSCISRHLATGDNNLERTFNNSSSSNTKNTMRPGKGFATESTTNIRADNAHLLLSNVEKLSISFLGTSYPLSGFVNGYRIVIFPMSDQSVRFHGGMNFYLSMIGCFYRCCRSDGKIPCLKLPLLILHIFPKHTNSFFIFGRFGRNLGSLSFVFNFDLLSSIPRSFKGIGYD
ncbi:hypothetical protein CWATWH0402_3996 [Crocosphaera watsonii WH 0402]|uniref:Uncharacterized protein n=1 Tax=Crocosphaera watsonii WH 0402 TaxID=1284629 RepID=T2JQH4_CROWT|nr:hypothetical protein CWATWH0402_3996 [Crocosphaera watsonii WH 0402]